MFVSKDDTIRRKVAQRFRHVYPGRETWVTAVQPDLLGEHFVARFMDVGRILQVIDGCQEPELKSALTVLTSLARRTGDSGLLAGVTDQRIRLVATIACRLAPQVRDPLGQVLATSLERTEDFALAVKLEKVLFEPELDGAVSLREVGATVYRMLRDKFGQEPAGDDASRSSKRARVLNNLRQSLERPRAARGGA